MIKQSKERITISINRNENDQYQFLFRLVSQHGKCKKDFYEIIINVMKFQICQEKRLYYQLIFQIFAESDLQEQKIM